MKTIIAIIIGAVVVVALAVGYALKLRGQIASNDSTVVRVEPAQVRDLIETVTAPGQVQPKTKVSISARVAARIVEIPFKEGDSVTKGNATTQPSVLVRLDSKDLEAQLRAAEARYAAQSAQLTVADSRISAQEATLDASKVMLADAERDLNRQRELLTTKDVSQSQFDTSKAKFDQLTAQLDSSKRTIEAEKSNLIVIRHELEAADAEIARARDSLSYTTITSPIDGVITRINSQVGELVVIGTMNNPGTVIMEVADLDTMLVNARIDEGNVAHVKVGQKAKVRAQAYADEVFDGTVDTVALSQTEEKDGSKYYKTEILLKTEGRRIFSGLTADVDIETARHENVLAVPSQAVLGRPVDDLPQALRNAPEVDQSRTLVTVVYRMVDGKSVVTPVKVGPSDVTHTLIESGLKECDEVIVGPYKVLENLANDQKVKDEKTVTTQPSTKA
ncbi:efflux RND transporter periplasmic adaptor subunit [soil metagenome]